MRPEKDKHLVINRVPLQRRHLPNDLIARYLSLTEASQVLRHLIPLLSVIFAPVDGTLGRQNKDGVIVVFPAPLDIDQ